MQETNTRYIYMNKLIYQNENNIFIRIILDANKLTRPNFLNWYRDLRIVLKLEKNLYVLKQERNLLSRENVVILIIIIIFYGSSDYRLCLIWKLIKSNLLFHQSYLLIQIISLTNLLGNTKLFF
jgi:hypothetical protein